MTGIYSIDSRSRSRRCGICGNPPKWLTGRSLPIRNQSVRKLWAGCGSCGWICASGKFSALSSTEPPLGGLHRLPTTFPDRFQKTGRSTVREGSKKGAWGPQVLGNLLPSPACGRGAGGEGPLPEVLLQPQEHPVEIGVLAAPLLDVADGVHDGRMVLVVEKFADLGVE